jgi:predicted house-cleaning noncanonical NTP pyrophosphatase (MazG superfamily)
MREKLIRDRIPELFDIPSTSIRVASDEELDGLLAAKLVEEAREYQDSRAIEELADVLEVIAAIARGRRVGAGTLEQVRAKKESERGGFGEKLVWAIPPKVDVPWVAVNEGEEA